MFRDKGAPEGRPLSAVAVAAILTEHTRHLKVDPEIGFSDTVVVVNQGENRSTALQGARSINVPAMTIAYRPDGRYVGPANAFVPDQFGQRFPLERHILVDDDHSPSREELEAIRVTEDGTVLNGWLRRPPPPPVEKPGPSTDPGVPLPDHVLAAIVAAHGREMTRRSLEPAPPGWNPCLALAFSVADGRFAGCTLDPHVAENAHLMVVLTTHDGPTVEALRRLRRHANGWVDWAPEDETAEVPA